MEVVYSESYDHEFYRFIPERVQSWLRGEGVEGALVYLGSETTVRIEVPMGTPQELLDKAVLMGRGWV